MRWRKKYDFVMTCNSWNCHWICDGVHVFRAHILHTQTEQTNILRRDRDHLSVCWFNFCFFHVRNEHGMDKWKMKIRFRAQNRRQHIHLRNTNSWKSCGRRCRWTYLDSIWTHHMNFIDIVGHRKLAHRKSTKESDNCVCHYVDT